MVLHATDPVTRILTLLSSHTGQDFIAYDRSIIERRIAERLSQLGNLDAEDYCKRLASDVAEANYLSKMFYIRYSRFFRQPLQFQLLRDVVIPPLLSDPDKSIYKVWSAACAGGEEAFSLAIILDEVTRSINSSQHISIFATDIAEDALAEGKQAVYSGERIEEVSVKRLKTYFIPESGAYRVCDALRQQVSFSSHDLLDTKTFAPPESIFGGFDLILCRNFLMYLVDDFYNQVFDKLFKALNPGGILMLGKAETVPQKHLPRLTRLYDFSGLYKKTMAR